MSTQSGSPQPPAAGGHPTPPDPTRKTPSMARFWSLAVLVAIALGVAGYFFGKSQGERAYDPGSDGYSAIYDKGYAAGQQAGDASGQATGQKSGEAAGKQAGLEEGAKQGRAQGTADGASTALGGFSSWQMGDDFYVVQLSAGPQSEIPYVVSSRVLMDPTLEYTPCQDDPGDLCTFPRPSTGGASAQTGEATGTTGSGASGGGSAQAGDD